MGQTKSGEVKNSGPAFPQHFINDEGMSLRDYFAGKALRQGMDYAAEVKGFRSEDAATFAAQFAYRIADAMIAEREKK